MNDIDVEFAFTDDPDEAIQYKCNVKDKRIILFHPAINCLYLTIVGFGYGGGDETVAIPYKSVTNVDGLRALVTSYTMSILSSGFGTIEDKIVALDNINEYFDINSLYLAGKI